MTFNQLGPNYRMVSWLDACIGRADAFRAADEVSELRAIETVLGMRAEFAGGHA